MEPFKTIQDARRFLEQKVYDHFRATAEWPRARSIDLDFHQLLDPLGGLELVCREIGSQRIWCGSPASEQDRVTLHIRAVAECTGGEADVTNFLSVVRLAADLYVASRGSEVTLSDTHVVEKLGLDKLAARRALELMMTGDGLVAGGSPAAVTLAYLVSRMQGVQTLEDYFARIKAHDARRIAVAQHAGRAARRAPRPPRYIFLSHAADDGALALYLANVLRLSDAQVSVFVASKAGDIPTGADWLDTIEEALRQADTYVLLLTPRSIERPWLWYESGAAWMSERPLIPLTAGGLPKGKVPYPLGARQGLSLEDPADVEQFGKDLGLKINDPASFCGIVRELGRALPPSVAMSFEGVEYRGQWFDWAGPFGKLDEWDPVPAPAGLDAALRAAGAEPIFAATTNVRQHQSQGFVRVHQTDRRTWRRDVLLPGHGNQVLLVRPPAR